MQNKHCRTCRNCSLAYKDENTGRLHCEIDEKPARNPRARALKCRSFLHFKECTLFRAFLHAANKTTHP